MKKLLLVVITVGALAACSKTTTTPTTPKKEDSTANACVDGNVCLNLDGTDLSKPGGGYYFSDTNMFVKYEEGLEQLSLDIFGNTAGMYTVSNVRMAGNARIYYFPDNVDMYMAETGTFEITSVDLNTMQISGKFSGTLYDYDSDTETFLKTKSIEIKDGEFNNIKLSQ